MKKHNKNNKTFPSIPECFAKIPFLSLSQALLKQGSLINKNHSLFTSSFWEDQTGRLSQGKRKVSHKLRHAMTEKLFGIFPLRLHLKPQI